MARVYVFWAAKELRDARIARTCWILLAAEFLIGARYSRFRNSACRPVATLVFPHSVEANCTLLTEGPSLLFAT